jgi:hypothetical protein
VQVRAFFRNSKKLFKRQSYDGLIDSCLSDELKGDVRYLICSTMRALPRVSTPCGLSE